MPYYHCLPLFISSSPCHIHPYNPTQSEDPQEVWVEVHRVKSAKTCSAFVLCLQSAVHVCLHGLSHRTNQTVFRSILFSSIISTCWHNHLIHGSFRFYLERWDKPKMNGSKPHDSQQVLKGFLQQKHIKLDLTQISSLSRMPGRTGETTGRVPDLWLRVTSSLLGLFGSNTSHLPLSLLP